MRIKSIPLGDEIGELCYTEDFDEVGKLEGVRIIEVRDNERDRANRFDCVNWAFEGDKNAVRDFVVNPLFPRDYREVIEPHKGDFVAYYDVVRGLAPVHCAIFAREGRVWSKFAHSHIYEHPLDAVSYSDDSEVRFFRRINYLWNYP